MNDKLDANNRVRRNDLQARIRPNLLGYRSPEPQYFGCFEVFASTIAGPLLFRF